MVPLLVNICLGGGTIGYLAKCKPLNRQKKNSCPDIAFLMYPIQSCIKNIWYYYKIHRTFEWNSKTETYMFNSNCEVIKNINCLMNFYFILFDKNKCELLSSINNITLVSLYLHIYKCEVYELVIHTNRILITIFTHRESVTMIY